MGSLYVPGSALMSSFSMESCFSKSRAQIESLNVRVNIGPTSHLESVKTGPTLKFSLLRCILTVHRIFFFTGFISIVLK